MLWWLYDTYKLVVGTRTIRRVFERKGEAGNRFKSNKSGRPSGARQIDNAASIDDEEDAEHSPTQQQHIVAQYQSPYAPMAQQQSPTDLQLRQALAGASYATPAHPLPPGNMEIRDDFSDDEEIIQLQLKQIELEKREVELKLRMRRMQQGKGAATPESSRKTAYSTPSTLYKPIAGRVESSGPKRDSRSKKKIEESKKRTAERQERMLRDLERRSRRREHLTAEWVQSKDIWPLRAQSALADLMHRYGCYTFSQNNVGMFDRMYRELYDMVDLTKGDWNPHVHDEMLRERMKRKMGQLRTKMSKTGEITGGNEAYGGWQRADNYTGEQAGQMDDGEDNNDHDPHQNPHHDPSMQAHMHLQAQVQPPPPPHSAPPPMQPQGVPHTMAGALHDDEMHYSPVPDASLQHHVQPIYGNPPVLQNQPYPMMDQHTHPGMLYPQMGDAGNGMVM